MLSINDMNSVHRPKSFSLSFGLRISVSEFQSESVVSAATKLLNLDGA